MFMHMCSQFTITLTKTYTYFAIITCISQWVGDFTIIIVYHVSWNLLEHTFTHTPTVDANRKKQYFIFCVV